MPNDPAPNKPKNKSGELSMEMRLLITFVLMGAVLFLTPYFLKTTAPVAPPAAKKTDAAKEEPAKTADSTKPAEKPAEAISPSTPSPSQVAGEKQDDQITVETDLYKVQFSNRGAVVKSWVLKKYLDLAGKPVELVNSAGGVKAGFPFTVVVKGAPMQPDPNQVLYAVTRGAENRSITFEFSDGKARARKSFNFQNGRYVVQVESELREQGRPIPHLVSWRGGFGDFTVVNTLSTQHSLYFDPVENKLITNDASAGKNGPVSVTGRFHFAGLEDTYFAAVALPATANPWEVQTWTDKGPYVHDGGKETEHVGVALGGEGANNAALYVGPKDLDILKAIDPKLEQVVDWGWFFFIAKPLFQSLNYVNDKWVHNYGWSIVVVTILINTLLLPLKVANVKSMKKMSALQPQVKEIQNKYANLPMRDPRRQQQQAEMMELYKKHGVNPLGGCVPMLLQFPFLFAFYKVLTVAIEMRGASWLWVTDLSQPESLAIRVLPLATIATQFVIQRMTPAQPGADPQQQRIMQFMPLMFIFIFYSVASGLVLYWLTGNVVGIAQQWLLNKAMHVDQPAVAVNAPEPPKKKK